MKVSIGLPTGMEGMMYPVPFIDQEQLVEVGVLAEKLGFHSVWGNDHMTTQRYVREDFETPPNFWEVLITLSFVAAATTKLRVCTGVLVPAMRRDVVVLAKQMATLDHFSKGRLMVGMGVGAYREEFEALQPGRMVHRGNMLEESIQALRHLFNERVASWEGEYYQYQEVEMYPKPLQDPFPIYIGGNNINAVRRAATFGQGWMGAAMPAEHLKQSVEKLYQFAESQGRDAHKIDIAPQLFACIDDTHEKARERFKNSQMYKHLVSLSGTTLKDQVKAGVDFEAFNLIGSADEIIEKAEKFRQAGATHLCGLLIPANSVQEFKDQMQRLSEEVLPYLN